MAMTGSKMRELRNTTGMTQAQFADAVGLSRKSINEAEARGERFVERRTEAAVRAITLVAKVRSRLLKLADQHGASEDWDSAKRYRVAATHLTGTFATDEETIFNLALSAADYRQELDRLYAKTSSQAA